jgi:sugar phosphate isomerase/epimerase
MMKVGCIAWGFTTQVPAYAPPYDEGIRAAGELGFDGIELILYDPSDLETFWTPRKIDEIYRLYRSYNLTVSEFALYQNVVAGLPNLDRLAKEASLEHFDLGCKLAKTLGAEIVNMVAQWPIGLKAPIAYPPSYFVINPPGMQGFEPKLKMELPKDFDWAAIWDNYVDSMSQCAGIAKRHGLRLALEGHANVIVSHTDSFLRLFDRVPDPALGTNLDVAWQFIQREYIPMSIYKLGSRILHVHARDGDGTTCYGLPVGSGILDWDGIVMALKDVGFDGFISLEMGSYNDPRRYRKQSLDYLREVIARVG